MLIRLVEYIRQIFFPYRRSELLARVEPSSVITDVEGLKRQARADLLTRMRRQEVYTTYFSSPRITQAAATTPQEPPAQRKTSEEIPLAENTLSHWWHRDMSGRKGF